MFLPSPTIALVAGFAMLAAGCVNWGDTSIANGAIVIDDGKLALHPLGAPAATIGVDGALRIGNQAVAVDASQREALKRYYRGALAVREHGIAAGTADAALAGESIKAAIDGPASSDSGRADGLDEAHGGPVTQAAVKICQDLADIKTAQDFLAARLPAFKPYAGVLGDDDIADCRGDGS